MTINELVNPCPIKNNAEVSEKYFLDIDTDRELAIAYGRGLQAVNILRNKEEDSERGVQFFPEGWTRADMFDYAEGNLAMADKYIKSINRRSIVLFCKLPLALAHKTLSRPKILNHCFSISFI